jgi:hypothetical protein
MSVEKLLTAQDVLMEVSVVSYEGNADCVVSRLLDARSDEYDFVSAEVAKLIAPLPTAK